MAITTAASQNYAFVETLTYTLRCNYVYSEPPISPIPGQPAEGVGDDPRYPNGRIVRSLMVSFLMDLLGFRIMVIST